MTILEIEQQLGVTYPPLYKQLAEAGMLAPDQPLPLLAYVPGFEVLSLEQVSQLAADLADPTDYLPSDYRFVPFGQNDDGDYYCFLFGESAAADCPIVIRWRSLEQAAFLAKNLQDFIFRLLLAAMTGQHLGAQEDFTAFRQQVTAMLATHERYLTEQQRTLLHELRRRAPQSYWVTVTEYQAAPATAVGYDMRDVVKTYRGFLTNEEVAPILAATIPFDELNTCIYLNRG